MNDFEAMLDADVQRHGRDVGSSEPVREPFGNDRHSEPLCGETHFFARIGTVKVVDGVDFTLQPGEVMGLVGESGSGKSVASFSILGLVDPPGEIVEGEILFAGRIRAPPPASACAPSAERTSR